MEPSLARHYIAELEEDSKYTVTVRVSNSAGSSGISNIVTAMTEETGVRHC